MTKGRPAAAGRTHPPRPLTPPLDPPPSHEEATEHPAANRGEVEGVDEGAAEPIDADSHPTAATSRSRMRRSGVERRQTSGVSPAQCSPSWANQCVMNHASTVRQRPDRDLCTERCKILKRPDRPPSAARRGLIHAASSPQALSDGVEILVPSAVQKMEATFSADAQNSSCARKEEPTPAGVCVRSRLLVDLCKVPHGVDMTEIGVDTATCTS